MGRLGVSDIRLINHRGLEMYNSLAIEALKKAQEQMKKGLAVFEEYCTEDCEHCPLYKANACGYYMELDPTAKLSDGLLSNFIDFHEERGYAEERNGIWED